MTSPSADAPPPTSLEPGPTEPTTATAPTEVALNKTPPTRRPLQAVALFMLGVLPAVALPLVWWWSTGTVSEASAAVVVVVVAALSAGWLGWLYVLPPPRPIRIDDAAIEVPWGRRRLRFALTELLVARRSDEGLVLFGATPPGVKATGHSGGVVVAGTYFVDAEGPQQVVAAIRDRLARLHGDGFLARLDDNERRQLAFLRRRPVVVWGVATACVVVFVLELATESASTASILVRAGANASVLVAQGEIWRLVTANLLHGSWLHLGMNLTALVSTGAVVERWLGRAGITLVLVGSGIAGQLASAALSFLVGTPRISVGLSGAVFGVLGVLLLSTWRFRHAPTGGLRVPASMWLVLLVTNGAISLIPIVDVAAHVGGFVGGVVVAALVAPRPAKGPLLPPASQGFTGIAATIVVVVAVIAAAWWAWPQR